MRQIGSALNTADPTYSAADIVGKTLIAKGKVNLYDSPYDDAQVIATLQPGATVGVVLSWVSPSVAAGRHLFYWQFLDGQGNYYYAAHFVGEFDIQSLQDQGTLTAAQQAAAAADANKSILQIEFEKYAPWVIGGVIGIAVLGVVLKKTL